RRLTTHVHCTSTFARVQASTPGPGTLTGPICYHAGPLARLSCLRYNQAGAHAAVSEKTILVVDDERHIVDLVKLYLEADGLRVAAAYDGNAALRLARTLRPALIVLDLMLPGIDGFEVCRTLRRES